jgi:hypothetical protein
MRYHAHADQHYCPGVPLSAPYVGQRSVLESRL